MKIILGDKSSRPIKGFGYIKFHLNSREFDFLHDVRYMLGWKKNLVSISSLEEKGIMVTLIRGKFLACPIGSPMNDALTFGSRFEGLYRVTSRQLLALVHDTNHLSELCD